MSIANVNYYIIRLIDIRAHTFRKNVELEIYDYQGKHCLSKKNLKWTENRIKLGSVLRPQDSGNKGLAYSYFRCTKFNGVNVLISPTRL